MISLMQIIQETVDSEIEKLKSRCMSAIERFESGPYTMILFKHETLFYGSHYEVGLTSDEEDFTTVHSQRSRSMGRDIKDITKNMNLIIKVLNEWVQKYGNMIVGSVNPKKTKQYHMIMSRTNMNVSEIKGSSMGYYFIIYGNNPV